MPAIRSGYSCPACKSTTGDTNEIIADSGRLVCSKIPSHTWNDSADFMALGPSMDFVQVQEKPKPQENQTSMNVRMSVPVYNALLARYGDKLEAAATGALKILVEGEAMIISESDVEQIGRIPGMPEKPKNARHLVGLIFAMGQQMTDAKQEADAAAADLKAYEGISPGRVIVDLGANFSAAQDKAKGEGLPTKVWLERQVATALENNWF